MVQVHQNPAVIEAEVVKIRGDGSAAPAITVDRLAVEAPLELRIGGKPATVMMRTPGPTAPRT